MSQTKEATGRAARYKRSFGGLVGSMIVLVVVVGAFVLVRGLNRVDPEVHPDRVDYLATVRLAQAAGLDVLYPATLPEGWRATNVESGDVWSLSLLTDDGRYVGVRQVLEDGTGLAELVTTYVDEEAVEGEPAEVAGAVAPEWRTFTDASGDHALAAEVDRQWVLVFGSASADDVEQVASVLTDQPV